MNCGNMGDATGWGGVTQDENILEGQKPSEHFIPELHAGFIKVFFYFRSVPPKALKQQSGSFMKFKLKININLKGYWEMVAGFSAVCSLLLESKVCRRVP